MFGKIACFVVLCMLVVAPHAQALTCGQVASGVAPCIPYLTRGAPIRAGCCNGIRGLAAATKTTADRKTACNCLKSAAGSIKGINRSKAAGLPGVCRVRIPYKISQSTDCSKIQ